jgi:CRP-like cAMP-binding protein
MAKATSSTIPPGNQLLARLPSSIYNRLLRHLKPVKLEPDQVLLKARAPFTHVYFPVWAVTSFLTVMENGDAIEVGTVGNEGMVGAGGLMGAPHSTNQVIVQVPGEALRAETTVVQKELEQDGVFRRLLVKYQSAFHAQVAQSVACNGLHPIDKRCCRWLLMTHDRVGAEVLPLTHEYLSYMLGVRRASITEVLRGRNQERLSGREIHRRTLWFRSRGSGATPRPSQSLLGCHRHRGCAVDGLCP